MKVITERTLIREVARRWRAQYAPFDRRGQDKKDIAAALSGIDPETATAKDVEAIIGNNSWTQIPICDECGSEDADRVIEVGAPPDHDSSTARLCPACVAKAVTLLLKP